MCNCLGWARDYSECAHLPRWIKPSQHHPNCEDYKLNKYQRLIIPAAGLRLIDTPEHIAEMIPEDDTPYTIEYVDLTQDQFESIPEFEGY